MNRWFFPSWCGDFRLEKDGDKKCILTIEDPTPAEIARLGKFLKKARSKGWIEQHVGFVPNGKIEIAVKAAMKDAGKLLLDKKVKGILTAVKSVSGKVSAVTDTDEVPDSADDAASVRRPTLCCPTPQPGPDVRASEVLKCFSTPEQWEEWQRSGMLHCFGGLSGRRYEILHRHHPLAIQRGKIVWDVESQNVMHCYDWSVPPPEEVLTMKLVLEHAEHWIRNPSGCLAGPGMETYNDPFVPPNKQYQDGIEDANVVSFIGSFAQSFINGFTRMFNAVRDIKERK